MNITIQEVSTADIPNHTESLQGVYNLVYQTSGQGLAGALTEHCQRRDFRLIQATYEGKCYGFAYGFTGEVGQFWRDLLADAVGEPLASQWLIGHFEFAEFGVIPRVRRRGIGTRLYQAIFSGLPHTKSILTVRDHNEPARRFYDKLKWRVLFEGFFTPGGRGPYILMGKELQ